MRHNASICVEVGSSNCCYVAQRLFSVVRLTITIFSTGSSLPSSLLQCSGPSILTTADNILRPTLRVAVLSYEEVDKRAISSTPMFSITSSSLSRFQWLSVTCPIPSTTPNFLGLNPFRLRSFSQYATFLSVSGSFPKLSCGAHMSFLL